MITREAYALSYQFFFLLKLLSTNDGQHHADVPVLIKTEDKFISLSDENVFGLPVLSQCP